MQPAESADGIVLAVEAARYLAAVEAFRREGHEPHWAAEGDRSPESLPAPSAPRLAALFSERRER
jgi:hypothetical protein